MLNGWEIKKVGEVEKIFAVGLCRIFLLDGVRNQIGWFSAVENLFSTQVGWKNVFSNVRYCPGAGVEKFCSYG